RAEEPAGIALAGLERDGSWRRRVRVGSRHGASLPTRAPFVQTARRTGVAACVTPLSRSGAEREPSRLRAPLPASRSGRIGRLCPWLVPAGPSYRIEATPRATAGS